MSETRKLLERQSAWQKQRAALTWSEKIRMAEAVRESAARLARPRRAADGREPVIGRDLEEGGT